MKFVHTVSAFCALLEQLNSGEHIQLLSVKHFSKEWNIRAGICKTPDTIRRFWVLLEQVSVQGITLPKSTIETTNSLSIEIIQNFILKRVRAREHADAYDKAFSKANCTLATATA